MKKKLPSVSIVTASYSGSLLTLDECLKRVRAQNYPQGKIEIILGHGGTAREIKPIAEKYKASYLLIPPEKQNAEYNRGVAFNKAKNELVLILDHDNFMPTKSYLRELVAPLLEHEDVVAVESCYYGYDRRFSPLDRYFALFGALDPVPYYFGKADRMRQDSKEWNLLGKAKDVGDYFIVEFEKDPRKIPTIGTNGCLMRRDILFKNAKISPNYHYPIDVMVDVIMKGYNKFAFVKNSITHLTGSSGFSYFMKRRLIFMTQYHFEDLSKRRYSVYMPGDLPKLIKFVLISFTFLIPFYDSLRGFLIIRDPAWFIHPFMCFGICTMYGLATVKNKLIKKLA